jgi:hypothetical protein
MVRLSTAALKFAVSRMTTSRKRHGHWLQASAGFVSWSQGIVRSAPARPGVHISAFPDSSPDRVDAEESDNSRRIRQQQLSRIWSR